MAEKGDTAKAASETSKNVLAKAGGTGRSVCAGLVAEKTMEVMMHFKKMGTQPASPQAEMYESVSVEKFRLREAGFRLPDAMPRAS